MTDRCKITKFVAPPAEVYPAQITYTWDDGVTSTFHVETMTDDMSAIDAYAGTTVYPGYTYNQPMAFGGRNYYRETSLFDFDYATMGGKLNRSIPDIGGSYPMGAYITPDRILWVSGTVANRVNISEFADWTSPSLTISSFIDLPGTNNLGGPRSPIVPLPHLGEGVYGVSDSYGLYCHAFSINPLAFVGRYHTDAAWDAGFGYGPYFANYMSSLASGHLAMCGYGDGIQVIALNAFGPGGCSLQAYRDEASIASVTGASDNVMESIASDGEFFYGEQGNVTAYGGDCLTKWDKDLNRIAGFAGPWTTGLKQNNYTGALGGLYLA